MTIPLNLPALGAFLSQFENASHTAIMKCPDNAESCRFSFTFVSGSYEYLEYTRMYWALYLDLLHRARYNATVTLAADGTPTFHVDLTSDPYE